MKNRVVAALRLALSVVLTIAVAAGAAAQTPSPAGSGHWEGSISVQGKELAVVIDLASKDGKWEGTSALPDMNAKGLVLSPITIEGQAVTLVIKGGPGNPTFKGTLSKDAKTMTGDFTQGPVAGTFTLAWKGEPKIEAVPEERCDRQGVRGLLGRHAGSEWHHASAQPQAPERGRGRDRDPDSLDQGNAEIPLGSIVAKGAHLDFTVPGVGGSVRGRPQGRPDYRHLDAGSGQPATDPETVEVSASPQTRHSTRGGLSFGLNVHP